MELINIIFLFFMGMVSSIFVTEVGNQHGWKLWKKVLVGAVVGGAVGFLYGSL